MIEAYIVGIHRLGEGSGMTTGATTTSLHASAQTAGALRRRRDSLASVAAYGIFAVSFLFAGAVVLGILP